MLFSIHHVLNKDLGGLGTTYNLAQELSGLGYQTDILSMSNRGHGVENIRSHLVYSWFTYQRLSRGFRDHDVLDLSSGDGWVFERFGRSRGPLLVARSHGLEHIGHLARLLKAREGKMALS